MNVLEKIYSKFYKWALGMVDSEPEFAVIRTADPRSLALKKKIERVTPLGCFSLTKKYFQQQHRITTSNSVELTGFLGWRAK